MASKGLLQYLRMTEHQNLCINRIIPEKRSNRNRKEDPNPVVYQKEKRMRASFMDIFIQTILVASVLPGFGHR